MLFDRRLDVDDNDPPLAGIILVVSLAGYDDFAK
jgi:hypothetical protein